jgi:GNAT superfamily N-acetyltransferase
VRIGHRTSADEPAVAEFLRERHSLRVARLGSLAYPLDHPALLAHDGDRLAGVLTYIIDGGSCEILTLHARTQWHGTGTALVTAVERMAAGSGCTRLWVITTNDNIDALRFYQRRGFRLVALHAGAVDASRATLKPELPLVGSYGIPIRDELELAKSVPRPEPPWRR